MYMMTPAGGFLHPVWQDWASIESFWPQIFYITKAAHIFRDFGAIFINILFKIKTDLSTFWAHFEILRNFLFQHLVALFASWISLSLRVSIYLEPHFHVRFWRSFCAAILRFTKQPSTGIRLRLTSCGPGFESQTQYLRVFNCDVKGRK